MREIEKFLPEEEEIESEKLKIVIFFSPELRNLVEIFRATRKTDHIRIKPVAN